jgi:hypothetical protein
LNKIYIILQNNTHGATHADTRCVTACIALRNQMRSYLAQVNTETHDLNFEDVCLILKAKYKCISSLHSYRVKSEVFIFKYIRFIPEKALLIKRKIK